MRIWKTIAAASLTALVAGAVTVVFTVRRAFRSDAAPARWETETASTVRNLAIPAAERERINPLALSAVNLDAGREAFIVHCAQCHGIDGGGRTPLGNHLYPRVPDLGLAPTQNLGDGELHYIIAHGVPWTGMPAWRRPRPESDIQLWQLVLYLRGLRPLSASAQSALAQTLAAAHYIGSRACARCHRGAYERWRKTPMANVVRDPQSDPGAIAADPPTNRVWAFSRAQVAFAYGSLWKQRYFTKIGDDYFPLPAQWDFKRRKWLPYFVTIGEDWWASLYPPDNLSRPTGPLCDGCHSVGYDIRTKRVAEWNVGCERCHGPGSLHAVKPRSDNILNPARMNYVAANDTCIQCHSQGRPLTNPIGGKYYDWPVGYRVGLRLQDFWKLEDHPLGKPDFYYFADGTAHKNRMQGNDFVQSVMYRRGITCLDCHDAHGTSNYAELRAPAQTLCLECHGAGSANGPRAATLELHMHHRAGAPGGRCVDCHMPAIETEGVPGAFVHAHTFRFIAPAMTDKYGIPNPCTACHVNKTTAWATAAMRGWSEHSPWRLQ